MIVSGDDLRVGVYPRNTITFRGWWSWIGRRSAAVRQAVKPLQLFAHTDSRVWAAR